MNGFTTYKKYCKYYSGQEPQFVEGDFPDTIGLETKLLLCIEQNPKSTQKEYAAQFNVSVPTIKRLFSKLQKKEILIRKGTNRKGQWLVIKHEEGK